jgi:integrase
VNVPAKYSETGKRARPTFKTKAKATQFAKALRSSAEERGTWSGTLRPSQEEDAHQALRLLEELDVSLLDAARFYRAAKDKENESLPLGEAGMQWLASCDLRPTTFSTYKATVRILNPIADRVLATLSTEEIEETLRLGSGKCYKLHRNNAFTFWRWAARKGWCEVPVFDRVEKPARQSAKPIILLTVAEAKKLLTTAEDHDSAVAAAYAVQLFTGVREAEAARLTWDDFTEDGLRIPSDASKLHAARFIPWTDQLKAWVDAYGGVGDEPILPPNWTSKDNRIRGKAGWSVYNKLDDENPNPDGPTWPRNALRKTHAAIQVALGIPIDQLTFTFGHGTGLETLRRNYAGAMTKRDAIRISAFGPKGTKIKTTKAA